MLRTPRVLGSVLGDKPWAQLEASSLKDTPKDDSENSWSERLRLAGGDHTKQIILDLASSYGNRENEDARERLKIDGIIAAPKGSRVARSLARRVWEIASRGDNESLNYRQAPPGVGKTTTAETVAIGSRIIHVAFPYDDLEKAQTLAIFKGFLEPRAKKGPTEDRLDISIHTWLGEDIWQCGWDGGQIRNIGTCAVGLCLWCRTEIDQYISESYGVKC
ncbi:hypothetical protein DID88_001491 [Monilinia fructigena]|uniref:Uncharacterized protein n=1 Tax=Monilinia fructigena TaxID=38457 RepID=A0A395IX93_9HELO|nr:hypothetical protein DID88_001491 [Monilinia fructigena]